MGRLQKEEPIIEEAVANSLSSKLLVLFFIIVAGVFLYFFFGKSIFPLESNSWQAVFLSNGQVYFGKLSREKSQYPVLREVYYLRVNQSPQPIREGEPPPTNLNLVKLGGELHGPEDEMRINREHILFIEDLKADSQLVQAIVQLKGPNQ